MPTNTSQIPSPASNPSAIPPRRSLRLTDETWAMLADVRGLAQLASEPSSVDSVIACALSAYADRLRAKLIAGGIDPTPPERVRWPVGVPLPRGLIDPIALCAPCPNVEP